MEGLGRRHCSWKAWIRATRSGSASSRRRALKPGGLGLRRCALPPRLVEVELRLGLVGVHEFVLEVAVHGVAQRRVVHHERFLRRVPIEQLAVGVNRLPSRPAGK